MNCKILVLNCGSSSIKYEVYAMPEGISLGKGLIERIGLEMGIIAQSSKDKKISLELPIKDYKTGIKKMLKLMTDSKEGFLSDISEIKGVGHRVVHGGEKYTESVLIDDNVINEIEDCVKLAPLHNPANLTGIKEMRAVLPNLVHVAVFDTSFHQTMPKESYLYPVKMSLYNKEKVRRFGFHGTSHKYVFEKTCELLKLNKDTSNGIILHLGNGASLCAVKNGKSFDTSMGMTPLSGVCMGTRSGDIDPGVIFYLVQIGYKVDEVNKILNKESGMLGLSGISSDMRDIWNACSNNDTNAQDAIKIYVHSVKRFLGAYFFILGRVDFVAFTAGVGENDSHIRERVVEGLENFGLEIDVEKNQNTKRGSEAILSRETSKVKIVLMPTNEELQIAKDTFANL